MKGLFVLVVVFAGFGDKATVVDNMTEEACHKAAMAYTVPSVRWGSGPGDREPASGVRSVNCHPKGAAQK